MIQEHGHQPERVHFGARRPARRGVDLRQFVPRPPFLIAEFQLLVPVAPFDRDPLEIGMAIVVDALFEKLLEMQPFRGKPREHRPARAAVTPDAPRHRHFVGAEAERGEQAGGGHLGMKLPRAVLHSNPLTVGERAIEFRRGAADLSGAIAAINLIRRVRPRSRLAALPRTPLRGPARPAAHELPPGQPDDRTRASASCLEA